MDATPKAKFDAAVKVIRSLPKNGSFQPSHEMMLRFYGFYKQATEGPCTDVKPSFWDLVKKAKWEAWNKLGDMPREEAMLKYVDALKVIIETMPQTQMVADFMDTLGNFYELVDDKSPIGSAINSSSLRSSPEREEGKALMVTDKSSPDGEDVVPQVNGDISDTSDTNHSALVEEALSRAGVGVGEPAVEEALSQAGPVGGESVETDTCQIYVKSLDQNENVNSSKQDGEDDEQPLTNGMGGEGQRVTNHVNSETESDSEEFCDTSDEPVLVNVPRRETRLSASTPLNKAGNHVRFSETNIVHTEVEVHSGRVSPIEPDSGPAGLEAATMPGTYSYGQQRQHLSESMFVNAPSQDSMNISATSQMSLGRGRLEQDFSEDSVISSDLNQSSSETAQMRGGGDTQQGRQGGYQPLDRGQAGTAAGSRGSNSGSGSGSRRGLFSGSGGGGRRGDSDPKNPGDVNEHIAIAMVRLQQDMSGVLSRLSSLETLSRHKAEEEVQRRRSARRPSWWPFPDLSVKSTAFIVLWPFIAHFLINVLFKRKRRSLQ
ncbi:acyl-CoA-binding domain-containing protein 5-like [Haliotis rufescens]|uniref:acyl-CoA-binding domain-containing protein 5-like n=1 Tax=Haliotis rufescens TaxID=6454 RepID=UPI00201F03FF|nr:acyl-CoA-binding domain-containing protein 5-like [Haliotis rufescens]